MQTIDNKTTPPVYHKPLLGPIIHPLPLTQAQLMDLTLVAQLKTANLLPKEVITIGAIIFYFSILTGIWIVAKIFPKWEARQIARQKELAKTYTIKEPIEDD